MYKYIYPITRYGELETVIGKDHLLQTEEEIMNFYDQKISKADCERIRKAYQQDEICDTFDYVSDNINRLDECLYKDLMGDCNFYEGVNEIYDNNYHVELGS